MTGFQAFILGIVQGITEFFPVSSSGHLVLGQVLFNIRENAFLFDIFVHLGSLFAVMIVFRQAIATIIIGTVEGLSDIAARKQPAGDVYRSSPALQSAAAIVIGTLPAVVVGFTLKEYIETLFQSAGSVLIAMGFTGLVLLATFLARTGTKQVGIVTGFLIGLAQALAITPGISRSGMTIASGLFLGIRRETAGEFSFLLSIPAILGATVLAVKDLFDQGIGTISTGAIAVGMAASFLSGWIALVVLLWLIKRGRLGFFGFYCLAVSIAGIIILTHAN